MSATTQTIKHPSPPVNDEVPIHDLRGEKVILDADLARIYGVTAKRFNEAVKRNVGRFPLDFRFQCTREEWVHIQAQRSQFATLKKGRGEHRKYLPHVFTEHGAVMAANILQTERAVEMSVFVVRAFIRMRGVVSSHKELAAMFAELEKRVSAHDHQLRTLFDAIRQLMQPPSPPKQQLGFRVEETDKPKNAKRK